MQVEPEGRSRRSIGVPNRNGLSISISVIIGDARTKPMDPRDFVFFVYGKAVSFYQIMQAAVTCEVASCLTPRANRDLRAHSPR